MVVESNQECNRLAEEKNDAANILFQYYDIMEHYLNIERCYAKNVIFNIQIIITFLS